MKHQLRIRLWLFHGLMCLFTCAPAWAQGLGTITIHNNTDATLTVWARGSMGEISSRVTVAPV